MAHCIAALCTLLLRLLLPPHGRHRAARRGIAAPLTPAADTAHSASSEPSPHPQPPRTPLLRGEDSPLVRPYVLTPAERRARKDHRHQQRQRRRALWLAVHGIDVGPRRIHGVEVVA
ncbi:hypothetical protein [Streptomyces bluensis]|uniref:hypothetical protein n=1 Tax=Streptomyces bluensis TaxID=33897 RepID=UPI00331A9FCE